MEEERQRNGKSLQLQVDLQRYVMLDDFFVKKEATARVSPEGHGAIRGWLFEHGSTENSFWINTATVPQYEEEVACSERWQSLSKLYLASIKNTHTYIAANNSSTGLWINSKPLWKRTVERFISLLLLPNGSISTTLSVEFCAQQCLASTLRIFDQQNTMCCLQSPYQQCLVHETGQRTFARFVCNRLTGKCACSCLMSSDV